METARERASDEEVVGGRHFPPRCHMHSPVVRGQRVIEEQLHVAAFRTWWTGAPGDSDNLSRFRSPGTVRAFDRPRAKDFRASHLDERRPAW